MSHRRTGDHHTTTTDFSVTNGKGVPRPTFIFANLDGSISAWNGTGTASRSRRPRGASFTGLAIGNLPRTGPQLYAADQNSGNIDVFNSKWQMTDQFHRPELRGSHRLRAFNVQNLSVNGTQTSSSRTRTSRPGRHRDEFTTRHFHQDPDRRHAGAIWEPWGLAIAPAGWGQSAATCSSATTTPTPRPDGDQCIQSDDRSIGGTLTLNKGQPSPKPNFGHSASATAAARFPEHALFHRRAR